MAEMRWFYLHANGSLISKRERPESDSDFVWAIWPIDGVHREQGWIMLVEAYATVSKETFPQRVRHLLPDAPDIAGALKAIADLATKWGFTDEDGQVFCARNDLRCFQVHDTWCVGHNDFVDAETSDVGFGDTVFDALVALAKNGETHGRLWSAPAPQRWRSKYKEFAS